MTTAGVDVQEKTTIDLVTVPPHMVCSSRPAPVVMGFNPTVGQVIHCINPGGGIGLWRLTAAAPARRATVSGLEFEEPTDSIAEPTPAPNDRESRFIDARL